MEELEFKQITEINESNLNIMTNWMYNWWGKKDGYTFEKVKYYMKHSMQKDRFPQTYGLFLDNKIIGMYQFTLEDLDVRPDIYPWLANVYIDEQYRNKGYARKLLENVKAGKVFNKEGKVAWICKNCGHIHFGENAPEVCPVCAHPQAYFEVKNNNY